MDLWPLIIADDAPAPGPVPVVIVGQVAQSHEDIASLGVEIADASGED